MSNYKRHKRQVFGGRGKEKSKGMSDLKTIPKDSCKLCEGKLKSDPKRSERVCMKCYAVYNWDYILLK